MSLHVLDLIIQFNLEKIMKSNGELYFEYFISIIKILQLGH